MSLTAKQEKIAVIERKTQIAIDALMDSYLAGESFHGACSAANIAPTAIHGATYYVYALVREDTDAIVYIGKGKGERMHQHVKDAVSGKVSGAKKHKGLRKLHGYGIEVKPYSIFEGMSDTEALRVEKSLIKGLRSDTLLNGLSGARSRNQCLMVKCRSARANLATVDQLRATYGPKEFYQKCARRTFANRVFSHVLAEMHIAEQTGYVHTDKWDATRAEAKANFLAKHPERTPPPLHPWPEFDEEGRRIITDDALTLDFCFDTDESSINTEGLSADQLSCLTARGIKIPVSIKKDGASSY